MDRTDKSGNIARATKGNEATEPSTRETWIAKLAEAALLVNDVLIGMETRTDNPMRTIASLENVKSLQRAVNPIQGRIDALRKAVDF